MIDIHTHILPGIDDGAVDVNISKRMLCEQRKNGVKKVFATPHYDCERTSILDFLECRKIAYEKCEKFLDDSLPEVRLGAEVRYSTYLAKLDLHQLTLADTNYLLLELPFDCYPAFLKQTIEDILKQDITPIIAHVERYEYFRANPNLLRELVIRGALGQINAGSLGAFEDKGFSKACIKHDLVQLVASDAHNISTRSPNLGRLQKQLPKYMNERVAACALDVWMNQPPIITYPTLLKKRMNWYV